MTGSPYTGRANRYEGALLDRLKDGRVNVCGITNRVWIDGKEYATFKDGNGYVFFKLIVAGKRRTFSLSRAVWMKHARRRIPPRFEVHHIDEVRDNNDFRNLAPIYKPDHPKFAGMVHRPPDDDEVPF